MNYGYRHKTWWTAFYLDRQDSTGVAILIDFDSDSGDIFCLGLVEFDGDVGDSQQFV